jgi:hypothetical protein
MEARIQEELRLLRRSHPKIEHGPKGEWVKIPDFPLPAGRFNQTHTTLLFKLPSSYPQTGPDNFFVDVGLRLKDGSNPPAFNANAKSSTGPAPIPGAWGWFSWHPQSWRPAATPEGGDNLSGFVRSVSLCLRGEES